VDAGSPNKGRKSVNEIGTSKPVAHPLDAFGTVEDLDCRGRRVLLRVDPFLLETLEEPAASPPPADVSAGPTPAEVAPDAAAAPAAAPPAPPQPTLRRLLELEARVVIATHFTPELRQESGLDDVETLATRLSERLGLEVFMPDEHRGDAAVRVIQELRQGQLCVLPDLWSAPGELKNDDGFARALSGSIDAYVFDAFSASHLELASTVKLPRLVPRRALGERCRREVSVLGDVFALSRGSVGLALGGRAFADKIDTLGEWLSRVDRLVVGGRVGLTLLAASGRAPAEASPEPERLAQARSLLARARDLGVTLTLPVDYRVQLAGDQGSLVKRPADVPAKARIIDVGPESRALFGEVLGKARHLLWWGPLGDLAHPEGADSSRELAELCAHPELTSVVLGADTRRFVRSLAPDLQRGIDLVSTGAAAARALLGGRRLPGIEAVRVRR
jgi:phosphoglycerate kinase